MNLLSVVTFLPAVGALLLVFLLLLHLITMEEITGRSTHHQGDENFKHDGNRIHSVSSSSDSECCSLAWVSFQMRVTVAAVTL